MTQLTELEETLKKDLENQKATLDKYNFEDKTDLEDSIFGELDIVENFMQDNNLNVEEWDKLEYFRDMQHDMVNDYAYDKGLKFI